MRELLSKPYLMPLIMFAVGGREKLKAVQTNRVMSSLIA